MNRSRTWPAQPDPDERADVNYAGAHHRNFGEEHHHKPTKAIIGVSILIVLSILLYEINSHNADHSSAPANQTVAWSNR